jgi:proteasome assembly chaperone (PAC2) family protein
LIAGWCQWADAGSVSTGLPQYLIERTHAAKIGALKPGGFYLFQLPGTHDFLRPAVRLNDGHREELQERANEFFRSRTGGDEFLVFLGEEPHRNAEQYAQAFFDAVEELGVTRVAAVAGVHAPVPYDWHREVSCVYSLPPMKDELSHYGVRFSNYEGGATISMYLASEAELRGVEFFRFCAMVPCYDFSTDVVAVERIAMDEDFRAWYELLRRLDHMFNLALDLTELERLSGELVEEWDAKVDHLARTQPRLDVSEYLREVNAEFTAESFDPLSGVWGDVLRDVFEGDDPL